MPFGNMGGPTAIVIILIVLLLFGAPKLPALARSIGQSMKILRKEVSSNGADKDDSAAEGSTPTGEAGPDDAPKK